MQDVGACDMIRAGHRAIIAAAAMFVPAERQRRFRRQRQVKSDGRGMGPLEIVLVEEQQRAVGRARSQYENKALGGTGSRQVPLALVKPG